MVGIVSYGAHIPITRLARDAIARAWNTSSLGGEKAVANFDEDSITMAVEAGLNCLRGIDRRRVDGLYFASTTSPYKEKQAASLVAAALDLRKDISTADFANSLRAGTIALRSAIDTVSSGSAKLVLVIASDCRLGAPQGEFEQNLGDGAVALLIGDSGVVVSVEDRYSIADDFVDLWRRDGDTFIRSWEDRFILTHGYTEKIEEAIRGLMNKHKLTAKDFDKVVLYAPDTRSHLRVAGDLGFNAKTQVQDILFNSVGNTGVASTLMSLVAALEEAKPGSKILLASYGDGSDAFALKVTSEIEKSKNRQGIKSLLARKIPISYEKYLKFRGILTTEAARRPPPLLSLPQSWRDHKEVISLYGHKCKHCGTLQFPLERVCSVCQTKDEWEEVRLSDLKGELFTYTKDFLQVSPDPPTVMTVTELEGGCRMFIQMTDRDPDEVRVGLPVEMTFRKIHDAGGVASYFWKCKPVR